MDAFDKRIQRAMKDGPGTVKEIVGPPKDAATHADAALLWAAALHEEVKKLRTEIQALRS
jgi:hypothetical protein